MSPSPRRLGDLKSRKQHSLESTTSTASAHTDIDINKTTQLTDHTTTAAAPATNASANNSNDAGGKFENISDNGSEISDEGYRSLGVIQQGTNSQSKRTSLHSQTSIEDGKCDDAKTTGEHFSHIFSTFFPCLSLVFLNFYLFSSIFLFFDAQCKQCVSIKLQAIHSARQRTNLAPRQQI